MNGWLEATRCGREEYVDGQGHTMEFNVLKTSVAQICEVDSSRARGIGMRIYV